MPASTSALMSCMLPTATLRCACYAVISLRNISAFLCWAAIGFSQRRRRVRHRQAAPGCRVAFSSSAVVPVPLPAGGRCAPMAWQPAPLLSSCMILWPQSVGKALVRHAKPATPRLACASCWPAICSTCGTRPLRPLASRPAGYIRPHCMKCAPVVALKLHLVVPTASRPAGLRSRHYAKRPPLGAVAQPSALLVRFAPYAPPSVRPCGYRGVMASVRRCAHRFGQWPTASHHLCAPLPAPGPGRCAALAPARRLPIRSPQG